MEKLKWSFWPTQYILHSKCRMTRFLLNPTKQNIQPEQRCLFLFLHWLSDPLWNDQRNTQIGKFCIIAENQERKPCTLYIFRKTIKLEFEMRSMKAWKGQLATNAPEKNSVSQEIIARDPGRIPLTPPCMLRGKKLKIGDRECSTGMNTKKGCWEKPQGVSGEYSQQTQVLRERIS